MFCVVLTVIVTSMIIGKNLKPNIEFPEKEETVVDTSVPHKGSIQVLNGCGTEGAANRLADYLRLKRFDVKDIGNATAWNYPHTMIISRTKDMSLAKELEKLLKTDKLVLVRTDEQLYDVTVVVGPDFEGKIK